SGYRKLKDADPTNPVFLVDFALGALNQKSPDAETLADVSETVSRLQQIEPESFRTAVTRARLYAVKNQPDEAVKLLKSYVSRLPSLTPEAIFQELVNQQKPAEAIAALTAAVQPKNDPEMARLLEHVNKQLKAGEEEDALAVLKRYLIAANSVEALRGELIRVTAGFFESIAEYQAAEEQFRLLVSTSQQPDAVLLLAAFLARRNRIDEALDICEAAASACRPETVGRVSVGVIRAGTATPDQVGRVEQRLLKALEKAEPAVAAQLSISLADLRDFQERYADAAAIYRKLLDNNDRNIVALNNLAWLISYQPVDRDTSLSYINRAIQLIGPLADLLDTRAVIRLNLDRPREAIQDLEDALKEVANASIWYHLALAQLKIGDKPRAAESFRKAEDAGFDPKSLHSLERSGYEQLLKQLGTDKRRANR
ncbi:MAG TPA: tetratricopeptide repeat protein, partial [Planctomycetaceae bacterium]|nr:tetratricopeptide repeat protein [Planctomycetaceae bacterium]